MNMNFKKIILISLGILLSGFILLILGVSIDNMFFGLLGLGVMIFSPSPIILFGYRYLQKKFKYKGLIKLEEKLKEEKVKKELIQSETKPSFFEKNLTKKEVIFYIFLIFVLGFLILQGFFFITEKSPQITPQPEEEVKNWSQRIPESIKNQLTSQQLQEAIKLINKTTPEFRQTFVSDYAKELAQKNKIIVLGVWADSLGIKVNYQMDDAWEIVERIKRTSDNFAIYRDEIKFLEFITIVTNKGKIWQEYQNFLDTIFQSQ